MQAAVTGWPLALLRLEGAFACAAALIVYSVLGDSWRLFALLCLAPDVSIAVYLISPKAGAAAYNLAHTYSLAALLAVAGWRLGHPFILSLALIWTAHIGFDRMLGYGLKYGSGFKYTHLGSASGQRKSG